MCLLSRTGSLDITRCARSCSAVCAKNWKQEAVHDMQIFGMHGINLPQLLETLRHEGEVVTIGTETGVLESKRYLTGGV